MSDKPLTHSQLFGPYAGPTGKPDPLVETALAAFLASLDESSVADPETLKEGRYRIAMRHVLATLGLAWKPIDELPTENGDGYEVYAVTEQGSGIIRNVTYRVPGILITEAVWTNENGDDLEESVLRFWRRPRTDNLPSD